MDISLRLKTICGLISDVKKGVDVGTDHAYVPIYLLKEGKAESFIASDINKGPVDKARFNICIEGLEDKIVCRLGHGLSTVKPNEVEFAIIAGMGGNLIRDIILEDFDVFKVLKFAVLQPVQNPEILREFIYKSGLEIICEELTYDENKYYEIIKVKFGNNKREVEPIFYEVSEFLLENKHPLLKEYLQYKLNKYIKIYDSIKEETELALNRKEELSYKIEKIKGIILCL